MEIKRGDRVTWKFGDVKQKGTVTDVTDYKTTTAHEHALIACDDGRTQILPLTWIKKLKPKKPRRECWVEYLDETIVQVHYEPFNCHCFLEHGHEVVHMREVIK